MLEWIKYGAESCVVCMQALALAEIPNSFIQPLQAPTTGLQSTLQLAVECCDIQDPGTYCNYCWQNLSTLKAVEAHGAKRAEVADCLFSMAALRMPWLTVCAPVGERLD